ncbi:uncharacterized protein LACBIDRAFT_323298 [Laccaria bicolor S238N-H82]|uniref:Predicted protein n=1 Tax=Laccaria bicolor (strain S238N-H82 / ATCC MYA-4686) TaxID=486041 RepID=B0CZS1_LACBS|nr:uncharacterized protein LACBIDRAFT_323298 [Laccaria bicolor S238N-H82]EDR12202.1 predicted protein [Laccaria bicolor S238N-H82]|eukprot:XP_001876466.1 predicted protein [Laccaria bicolor S238N-H82]
MFSFTSNLPYLDKFQRIPSVVCERCGQFSGPALEHSLYVTPPTLEVLRENATPDSDTRHEIEAIVRRDDADIDFLDREISKLQTTLLDLQRRRQAIQVHVDRNKALLAPIRRLPVEILWRKVDLNVVALPALAPRERFLIFMRFVNLAHNQSGTRPVCMSITPQLNLCMRDFKELQNLFPILKGMASNFSGHWDELSIDIEMFKLIKGPEVKTFSNLKRLTLSASLRIFARCCLPHNLSQLTHLTIINCFSPVTRLVNMPWSQITHFESQNVPINYLGPALGQMSALTHAHISALGSYEGASLQPSSLPHLRDLTLSCSHAAISEIAGSLTTPSLSRLRAIIPPGPDEPQFHSLGLTLRALIDRSSAPIAHLGLQHISAEAMKDTFEGLPSVESLDLSIREDSDALNLIMNELAWKTLYNNSPESDVPNLLPNLQLLTIRKTSLSGTLPGIIQMLCSRLNTELITLGLHPPPARLRKVCFRSVDSVPLLLQLRQLGVAVDCIHELRGADLQQLTIDVAM